MSSNENNERVQGDNTFEVEKILGSRRNKGVIEYKIQWLGYPGEDTWEPAWALDCPDKLADFKAEEEEKGRKRKRKGKKSFYRIPKKEPARSSSRSRSRNISSTSPGPSRVPKMEPFDDSGNSSFLNASSSFTGDFNPSADTTLEMEMDEPPSPIIQETRGDKALTTSGNESVTDPPDPAPSAPSIQISEAINIEANDKENTPITQSPPSEENAAEDAVMEDLSEGMEKEAADDEIAQQAPNVLLENVSTAPIASTVPSVAVAAADDNQNEENISSSVDTIVQKIVEEQTSSSSISSNNNTNNEGGAYEVSSNTVSTGRLLLKLRRSSSVKPLASPNSISAQASPVSFHESSPERQVAPKRRITPEAATMAESNNIAPEIEVVVPKREATPESEFSSGIQFAQAREVVPQPEVPAEKEVFSSNQNLEARLRNNFNQNAVATFEPISNTSSVSTDNNNTPILQHQVESSTSAPDREMMEPPPPVSNAEMERVISDIVTHFSSAEMQPPAPVVAPVAAPIVTPVAAPRPVPKAQTHECFGNSPSVFEFSQKVTIHSMNYDKIEAFPTKNWKISCNDCSVRLSLTDNAVDYAFCLCSSSKGKQYFMVKIRCLEERLFLIDAEEFRIRCPEKYLDFADMIRGYFENVGDLQTCIKNQETLVREAKEMPFIRDLQASGMVPDFESIENIPFDAKHFFRETTRLFYFRLQLVIGQFMHTQIDTSRLRDFVLNFYEKRPDLFNMVRREGVELNYEQLFTNLIPKPSSSTSPASS